jgi:hypothetical protein
MAVWQMYRREIVQIIGCMKMKRTAILVISVLVESTAAVSFSAADPEG